VRDANRYPKSRSSAKIGHAEPTRNKLDGQRRKSGSNASSLAFGRMQENPPPSAVAKEAFECWKAGNRGKAVELYSVAIRLCEPDNWLLTLIEY
jgi:hypothetical protein